VNQFGVYGYCIFASKSFCNVCKKSNNMDESEIKSVDHKLMIETLSLWIFVNTILIEYDDSDCVTFFYAL